jgi:hypothetical protein
MYKKKAAKKEPKMAAPKAMAPAPKPPSVNPPQKPPVDKFGHLMMVYFSKDKAGPRYLVNKTTRKAFWAGKSEDQLAIDNRIETITILGNAFDWTRANQIEAYGRVATPAEMGLK